MCKEKKRENRGILNTIITRNEWDCKECCEFSHRWLVEIHVCVTKEASPTIPPVITRQ